MHKQHHEFRSPIALASGYAHPVEFLFGPFRRCLHFCLLTSTPPVNVIPLAVGPLVMRAHLTTTLLWFAVTSIGTEVHHCGYRFPWHFGDQPNFHDYHHEKFNFNYGLLGILDKRTPKHASSRLANPHSPWVGSSWNLQNA